MRNSVSLLPISLILILHSCGPVDQSKNVDEGKIEGRLYTSQEIGWTIEIPEGWSVIEKEQAQQTTEKGLKALEETVEGDIDYSGLKNLIAFEKNKFNIFQSTSEPFELEYEGEWEVNSKALKEIIYETYTDQGMNPDSTATTIEKIDGLNFQTYAFTIRSRNGEVILKQMMFSRLINGYDFGVNLNYNNDEDRDELLKAFRNSKFRKDE